MLPKSINFTSLFGSLFGPKSSQKGAFGSPKLIGFRLIQLLVPYEKHKFYLSGSTILRDLLTSSFPVFIVFFLVVHLVLFRVSGAHFGRFGSVPGTSRIDARASKNYAFT